MSLVGVISSILVKLLQWQKTRRLNQITKLASAELASQRDKRSILIKLEYWSTYWDTAILESINIRTGAFIRVKSTKTDHVTRSRGISPQGYLGTGQEVLWPWLSTSPWKTLVAIAIETLPFTNVTRLETRAAFLNEIQ